MPPFSALCDSLANTSEMMALGEQLFVLQRSISGHVNKTSAEKRLSDSLGSFDADQDAKRLKYDFIAAVTPKKPALVGSSFINPNVSAPKFPHFITHQT